MDTTPENATTPLSTTGTDAPEVSDQASSAAAQTAVPPAAGPGIVTKPTGRPLRMSTVVWGVIITVIGVGIVARGLGADFDNQLAFIIVLVAAGAALVLTSIYSAVRRR